MALAACGSTTTPGAAEVPSASQIAAGTVRPLDNAVLSSDSAGANTYGNQAVSVSTNACVGSKTATLNVYFFATRQGQGNGAKVWANSAVLDATVSVDTPGTTSGFSATTPADITLSETWVAAGNGTKSTLVPAVITFAPTSTGSKSGTVTFKLSGQEDGQPAGTILERTFDLNVTGTAVNCGPTEKPTINIVSQVEGNVTGGFKFLATADLASATSAVNDPNLTLSCTPAPGANTVLPLGSAPATNTVNCTATDRNGTSTKSQVVTVVDTTAPVLSGVPASFSVEGNAAGGANVTYTTPTATDIVDAKPSVTCTPASGSLFPLGATTVTCTAKDQSNNPASSSFTVTVKDSAAPTATIGLSIANPDGSNGWYKTFPTVTVTATDTVRVSGITCTGATVGTITGLNTTSASAPLTIAQGTNDINCTATDGTNASAAATKQVKLDTFGPSVSIAPTAAADGLNGWYKSDISFKITSSDATSGVASCDAVPALTTDNADYKASTTCTDSAGNTASATSASVKLDKTAPAVSPADVVDAAWRNTDLAQAFTASDATSGLVNGSDASFSLTASSESADAAHPTEVTRTVTDQAGNSTTRKVSALIDKTAPVLSADITNNTWSKQDVTGAFTASDAKSGLADASNANFTLTASAETASTNAYTTVTKDVADKAGNKATATLKAKIDKTAPTASLTAQGTTGTGDWFKGDVTFVASGTDSLSGLTGCTTPDKLTTDAASYDATTTCTDNAGNTATKTITVKRDATPPTAVVEVASGTLGNNQWYTSDVTFKTSSSSDVTSQLASCTAVPALTADNGSYQASTTCTDNAGNTAIGSLTVKRDATAPSISDGDVNDTTWRNTAQSRSFTASDATSGLVNGSDASFTLTASADSSIVNGNVVPTSAARTVTDAAGNKATRTISFLIDTVKPVISVATTPDANSAGWNKSDVSVNFTCSDALSGLASGADGTCDDATVSTETDGQTITRTVKDKAGNSASASSRLIQLDKTAPFISGSRSPAANSADWNNTDVKASFQCSDTLSGVGSCTSETTVATEGANQYVTGTATDVAGNQATATVGSINIDKTAPSLSVSETPAANAAGWNNTDVTVNFTCSDALSGLAAGADGTCADEIVSTETAGLTVARTVKDKAGNSSTTSSRLIKLDKTAPTISAATSRVADSNGWFNKSVDIKYTCADAGSFASGAANCPATETLNSDTTTAGQTYSKTVTDVAGNTSVATNLVVKFDNTPPVVHLTASGTGANGWYRSDVSFSVTSTDALSGSETCDAPANETAETAGKTVPVDCYDIAGNKGSDSITVKIDKTAPTVTVKSISTPDGKNGWYWSDVKVDFQCSDVFSGVDGVCPTVTSTGEGDAVTVASGKVLDKAGNEAASTNAGPFKVDKTDPATPTFVNAPSSYLFGQTPPTPSCSSSDAVSGLASCVITTSYDSNAVPNGGPYALVATATDISGRTATATMPYTVLPWTLNGFFQPVDMPSAGTIIWNTIKGGSTLPLKFKVFAGTTELTSTSAVKSTTYLPVTCSAAPEAPIGTEELSATGGTVLRYDTTAGQFIFNWQSPKQVGLCYKVSVTTQDGTSLSAYFKTK